MNARKQHILNCSKKKFVCENMSEKLNQCINLDQILDNTKIFLRVRPEMYRMKNEKERT